VVSQAVLFGAKAPDIIQLALNIIEEKKIKLKWFNIYWFINW
jgi:hypothetical protein